MIQARIMEEVDMSGFLWGSPGIHIHIHVLVHTPRKMEFLPSRPPRRVGPQSCHTYLCATTEQLVLSWLLNGLDI